MRGIAGLLLLAGMSLAVMGQSAPAFEVASIKPSQAGARDQFESECAGGRYISRGAPLLWTIKWAFTLNDYQVMPGWPAWLNSFGTYDIEAKAKGQVTEDQCRTMLQSLFKDRFKLHAHREMKNLAAYALVAQKNGPRLVTGGRVTINGVLKQSASEREPPQGWTTPRLANYLASVRGVDRPVLDRTGLTGIYGLTLNYSTADRDDRPDIFTALPEQLGLKLEAVKAPIETFVIDHVEKPSGN